MILIPPASLSESYLYFDSNTKDNFTHYQGEPDAPSHPIYNSFKSLSASGYDIIAWNDQLPNGSASSSKAHSKTVIGYGAEALSGVFFVHSMPMYPAIKGKTINETINDSQSIYGQHAFCFNSGNKTKELLTKASIITPYFYSNTANANFSMSTSSNTLFIQTFSNILTLMSEGTKSRPSSRMAKSTRLSSKTVLPHFLGLTLLPKPGADR